MDQHGRTSEGLHQIGFDRFLEQNGHRSHPARFPGIHCTAVPAKTDQDIAQALFQIVDPAAQAQDGHYLRSGSDVEALLTRHAVTRTAQSDDHLAQHAVIYIHHPFEQHRTGIDAQPPGFQLNIIVYQGGKQIVRFLYRRKISGKMQVDVLHRQHLGISSSGSASLQSEDRSQRGFPQGGYGALPDAVQSIGQPDRDGRFAFPARSGRQGRNQHQTTARGSFRIDAGKGQLGNVPSIGFELRSRDGELFGNLRNGKQTSLLCDLQICFHLFLCILTLRSIPGCFSHKNTSFARSHHTVFSEKKRKKRRASPPKESFIAYLSSCAAISSATCCICSGVSESFSRFKSMSEGPLSGSRCTCT